MRRRSAHIDTIQRAASELPQVADAKLIAVDPVDPLPQKLEREHARQRQRIMHAAERARSRNVPAAPRSENRSHSHPRPLNEKDEREACEVLRAEFWADVWDAGGAAPELANTYVKASAGREVRLADLVRPVKNKGSKRENDFELVPRVRPVIVLDDFEPGADALGVEAWEYVSNIGGGEEPRAILSYADVARKTA
ncbi:hypothetical protein K488DRAFT_87617 [Vararia minispora EC-137]|uniref:Uncharacterized protein n=1 Tax=Vararia minispora EC-137 TaxID=1314806 RepID=A0ACB8QFT9_9AGAM|nr:hypothetical protein K488DRAFT_87617 [Vararia minispora EC-137]